MADIATFKYGKLSWLGLVLSAAVVTMAAYAFISASRAFSSGDLIYFVVGIPCVAAFAMSGLLAYRDVVVSSEGIGRSLFGIRTRFILWHQVTEVRCGVLSAGDRTVGSYHLRVGNRALLGGVRVMTMIDDIDALVARIDAEVMRRAIPVTAWDLNTLITVNRLPPPKKGAAAWN
ncbi:MAG: hypothetical protein AAGC76_14915 [Luteibacter sp.]|uniref:hypothetical protein n=1 Tax=Luteibacter sp. TaxID=1886636 RepID=UPI002807C7F8|nr:hypothetical protein [Luteibacter sp.]MDQ7997128.1 hypothetical protein [Luteibacter sp.]MDQ8049778.1 hypothetical protein [Luteibacter sp.]